MQNWRTLFSLALALSAAQPGWAGTAPDFSGDWIAVGADKDGSTSGSDAGASPSRHGGHGMGGGGHGGAGGGHHHMGNSAADAPSGGSAPAAFATSPRSTARALTIRQSDVVFDIAAEGGKRTVYRFDNRNNYGAAYGGTVTLTWAAPEIVIETHPDAGGSIEEHYRLADDGRKLVLRTHEQRAGADAARDLTRTFVRRNSQEAATTSSLP